MLLARASGLEGFARHVVIKRIRPELAHEERFVKAFLEEARISASLHHQNVVQVHDIGDEGGSIYFAMEYVHGEDCRKLLNRVRERNAVVPLQQVVSIIMATAAGLDFAHEQTTPSGESKGIIHRDVSPANILIGYDGSVKLVDFGLAKAASRSTNATASGTAKGKSSYLSPEQCTGKPLDRRTDIFSLGIVLYELLTAQRLFKGMNEFMTMAAIVDGEIPRPSSLRPEIPPSLDEIVLRALARDPAARYQTAEALRESLEAFALAQELRTSNKALADYLISLFGERPEPWLAEAGDDPAWEQVEMTHAGLVGLPRDQKQLLERYAADAESPLAQAQSEDSGAWTDEDEHEATVGQLPSLRRIGPPTEPTQTLRRSGAAAATAATVNANVRPRRSEPVIPAPPGPDASTSPVVTPAVTAPPPAAAKSPGSASSPAIAVSPHVRPRASEPPVTPSARGANKPRASEPPSSSTQDLARKFDEPTATRLADDDPDGPEPSTKLMSADAAAQLAAATRPLDDTSVLNEPNPADTQPTGTITHRLHGAAQETTAPAKPLEITHTTQATAPAPSEPGSSTVVEPPIFDGGVAPEVTDDDDDFDGDEPATELAVNAPEHPPEPPKEKVPLALRRPPRVVRDDELPRAQQSIPAPLRPAPRVVLPGSPTGSMGALAAREVTPSSSPVSPVQAQPGPASRSPSFAGVDPASVAASFQAPVSHASPDVIYQVPPSPLYPLDERISGLSGGSKRTLVIIGVSVSIIVGALVAMRACDDGSTSRSVAPADAQVELDAADDDDDAPRDAGTRSTDAGVRSDTSKSDAAGAGSTTSTKKTKRTSPKRPKSSGTR